MDKCLIVLDELLIANQQFSESVEPRVRRFNDPPSVLWRTAPPPFLAADPGSVPLVSNDLMGRISIVTFVSIEKRVRAGRERQNDCIEDRFKLSDIMPVGSGYD